MSNLGRTVGLLLAIIMFVCSVVVYLNTGDWVAAVFALGSLGYGLFFFSQYQRKDS